MYRIAVRRLSAVVLVTTIAALAACGKEADKAPASASTDSKLEEPVHAKLAHADHSPQRGGQLLMAEDGWHHVEGTLPSSDRFVLWLFDQFTEPLEVGKTVATARITVKRRSGSKPAEYAEVPMSVGVEGRSLAAALPAGLAFPISVRAVVTFEGKSPFTFDFQFQEPSVASPPGPVKPHPHGPAAEVGGAEHGATDDRPVPTGRTEILAGLEEAMAQATGYLANGKLAEVHKAADRIGKLATALGKSGGAVGRLEKLATDLDAQGDAGNAAGVREVLGEIVKDVATARK